MESKKSQDKSSSSRKSNLIIITPDELAKLGLIPNLIHKSNITQKIQANGGNEKEKPGQHIKANTNFIPKPTELNFNISNAKSNRKIQTKVLKSTQGDSSNLSKLNISNKKLDNKDIPNSLTCEIKSLQNPVFTQINTNDIKSESIKKCNSKTSTVKITGNTSVQLSRDELKYLTSNAKRETFGEKSYLINSHSNSKIKLLKDCDIDKQKPTVFLETEKNIGNSNIPEESLINSNKNETSALTEIEHDTSFRKTVQKQNIEFRNHINCTISKNTDSGDKNETTKCNIVNTVAQNAVDVAEINSKDKCEVDASIDNIEENCLSNELDSNNSHCIEVDDKNNSVTEVKLQDTSLEYSEIYISSTGQKEVALSVQQNQIDKKNCSLRLLVDKVEDSIRKNNPTTCQNEPATNKSPTDLKLPRKKGRPKKLSNTENNISSSSSTTTTNNVEKNKEEHDRNLDKQFIEDEIKLPKKRGRPKKISNIQDNVEDNVLSPATTISKLPDEDLEQVATSTPLPKKRGRKKKSEQPVEAVPLIKEEIVMDTSRSGRKRKKVNYLEMLNELEENTDVKPKKKHTFRNGNVEHPVKKQKVDETIENTTLLENEQKMDDAVENTTLMENEQKMDDAVENTTLLENEQNKCDSNENTTIDSSNIDQSEVNKIKRKRGRPPKFNRTGKTVDMMNSIFAGENTALLENEQNLDDTVENTTLLENEQKMDDAVENTTLLENEQKMDDAVENTLENTTLLENEQKMDDAVENTTLLENEQKMDDAVENTTLLENEQKMDDAVENTTLLENEQNKCDSNENTTIDSSNIDQSEGNKIKRKRGRPPKFKRTGKTVDMMNSIFAAATKNISKGQNEDSIHITGSGFKEENIILDENNMATCISCKKKINNDEWVIHNRHEHNNLAWREGESEIMLDNSWLIANILKPILREDKILLCKKCKHDFKKVSSFISHMEDCYGISSKNLVTCAVCKISVDKARWAIHKQRRHNNLAWRVGEEPLDLNDKSLVVYILSALYKAKKPLYCEKCDVPKKSVVGFLSHQAQCGVEDEDVRVKCQFCEKKVLPVSMESHVKMVHETPKENRTGQNSNYFDVDVANTTLPKRKAAKSALAVINKFSNVQEHSQYYVQQANFSEEQFVQILLKKELSESGTVRCKFNNCSHISDSVISMADHMNSCENKPEQYYMCRKCLEVSETEGDIKEHLKNAHDVTLVDDNYEGSESDDEDEKWEQYDKEMEMRKGVSHRQKSKLERDPNYRVKPTFIVPLLSKIPNQLFSKSYDYTMEFCQEHYSEEKLFSHLCYFESDWVTLDAELIYEYLPRYTQSCDVAKTKVKTHENVLANEYTFKKFDLFEVEVDEESATIFCGGPIQAMAWMPTPYTSSNCRQVLAVATLNDFDVLTHRVNVTYKDKSVIQFWDFGVLKNKSTMPEPKLMFLLAHDYGPVWHLEWCPSGCFNLKSDDDNPENSRMGLLAVAGSDSFVYIYSIPLLKEEEMGVFYKVRPLLKLRIASKEEEYLGKEKFYATKISWSKASGHRYIAVGYTDGMVGLFDINTDSNLLRCKDEDCDILQPYYCFQAHSHVITVLDLIHLADGKRWLLTGSTDRHVVMWDLSSGFKIVSKRGVVSDGLWLSNWISFITVYDESGTFKNSVPIHLTSFRDYLYDRVNFSYSSSTVTSISASSWLNGIMYGNTLGQVIAYFPHQLLVGADKRLWNYPYSFSCTKLINKRMIPEERVAEDEEEKSVAARIINMTRVTTAQFIALENLHCNKYEPYTYSEAVEKYGLLFCDKKMDCFKDFDLKDKKAKSSKEFQFSKANKYSMQAINKVAFNPNLQASLYFAIGYQVGFIRVNYMKFLEKDRQIQ